MKYSRAHAIEMGKRLVVQDLHRAMGGQAFPGSFRGSHATPLQAAHQQGFAAHRDTGGGLRWNAMGSFAPNPVFGMHPANVMQIPPMSGPGGYTSAPNQNTSPAGLMMASQTHANGGGIDENALHHARCILEGAKRSVGGQVSYKSGGAVPLNEPLRGPPQTMRGPKEIVALMDKIECENPRVSADRHFSYLCAKSPEVRRIFAAMLKDGYSRSGARAMIEGSMRNLAAEQE